MTALTRIKHYPTRQLSVVSTLVFLLAWLNFFSSPAEAALMQNGVLATADWPTQAAALISVDPLNGPRTTDTDILPVDKDETVVSYGYFFYRLGRLNAEYVQKYHISQPDQPIYDYSTLEQEGAAGDNPQDLVFVNDTKAYLIFLDGTKIWIVNPSAQSQAEFKTGEIDVSAYADSDGKPEGYQGVIVDGKLFVVFQRLDQDNYWTPGTAYLGVFDVATDTEIDTGGAQQAGDPLGVALPVGNPGNIKYDPDSHLIYVSGQGDGWVGAGNSGIATVDPDTYQATHLLADTDAGYADVTGIISTLTVVDAAKGYFVAGGWQQDNQGNWFAAYRLYPFDPLTGAVSASVTTLDDKNLWGGPRGLGVDKNQMVWVLNRSDVQAAILDPADDSIDESVSTGALPPQDIVFCPHDVTDTDGDDIPDFADDYPNDPSRGAVQSASGKGLIAINASGQTGVTLSDVSAIADTAGSINQNGKPEADQHTFDYGLIDFNVTVPTAGDEVQVTLTYPEDLPEGSVYYMVDANGFYEYPYAVINGAVVTLTLKDGDLDYGDKDGTADGIITDPGGVAVPGPGYVPPDSGGDGGSSGCFISTTVANKSTTGNHLSPAAAGLLALVIAVGLLGRRRHN